MITPAYTPGPSRHGGVISAWWLSQWWTELVTILSLRHRLGYKSRHSQNTVDTDIPKNADAAFRIQIYPVSIFLYAQTLRSKFLSPSHITAMATNSVRRLFIDVTRESQHRVASASSSSGCSCNSWSSSSSSRVNPPITMMANMVKEDAARQSTGHGSWGSKKSWTRNQT